MEEMKEKEKATSGTKDFFIEWKTTAQSRRRALQTLAALGLAALGTTASARAAAEKTQDEERAPYYRTPEELEAKLGVDVNARRPDDYVRVVYFHRTPGCANC